MSIRIALDNQPELYTNLDVIQGRIVLSLNRAEQVGGIVVKLEGECKTALTLSPTPFDQPHRPQQPRLPSAGPPGSVVDESHKILYKFQQVFPTYEDDAANSSVGGSYVLQGGLHEFPFRFKLPLNNMCSDQAAMAKMGGLGGIGGFSDGSGIFGLGGMRVMDGSKQLFLQHITKTLPPSFTSMPGAAEVRYYLKVTIQRPGLLRENWRYQTGFKFMPVEPPRPPLTGEEVFARRSFTFSPRASTPTSPAPTPTPTPTPTPAKKRSPFFGFNKDKAPAPNGGSPASSSDAAVVPPSVEISARLPHPSILTCNQPIPLRILAKKLLPSHEQVYITSLQIEVIGNMTLRAHEMRYRHSNRWIVVNQTDMAIPVLRDPKSEDLGVESVVPDDIWRQIPLPNTIGPSFTTCNLQRTHELELKIGLSWGLPSPSRSLLGRNKDPTPQSIYLPLHFSKVQVYSGISPPGGLATSAQASGQLSPATSGTTSAVPVDPSRPPRLPPRTNTSQSLSAQPQPQPQTQSQAQPQTQPQTQPAHDPLYPPQLDPSGPSSPYDDAPPSYDEAMAETATGPSSGGPANGDKG
ncbi:hypothetical protein SODALDRAFT_328995 [Sodiomyces alkalinus F11]|uniref:Arrestin-like N-terminal domain-containing protein n=1 Tax=Sodiomyces alkalinus (strain CBS 110278 / VKM F-3762 / F11) TaxID=1314773 RepID=A0A3N2PMR1_SODAK|nr:hypothetical protein SODALDRAFT_328995 [Sodiomyces alkalinus F11]ROT35626.1 hypothetical protein SODALDRAFT_328995 [Sodiomyces alkalinus F11]